MHTVARLVGLAVEAHLDLKVKVEDVACVWLHAEHLGHIVALALGAVEKPTPGGTW